MKKKILLGVMIGVVLGALQLLIPYTLTSARPSTLDGLEYFDGRHFVRGFPIRSEFTGMSPMPNPPITPKLLLNIPILILASIVVVYCLFPVVRILLKTKRRKYGLIIGVLLGVALGVGQLFHYGYRTVHTPPASTKNRVVCTPDHTTPDCQMVCADSNRQGDYCIIQDARMTTRGWPYEHDTYKLNWNIYESGPLLLANFAVFLVSVPLTTSGLVLLSEKLYPAKKLKKSRKK